MERTWKPTAAGVLSITGGAINVIWGIGFTLIGGLAGGFFGIGWLGALGTPAIILGIIAIVGGIFALRRRTWGLALVGSICALIGPAGLLGIFAIIFVSMGKGEFE